MPVSGSEQQIIQDTIDSASPQERDEMRAKAEAVLAEINVLMGQKFLSREEKHTGDIAVEVLTRLDATQLGRGWLYRSKRRFQLLQMYLGN